MPASRIPSALVVVFVAACGDRGGESPRGDVAEAATVQVAPQKKRPAPPPDPPPPAAALANEAEALEIQLRRTDVYDGLWTGPRDELNAFLTALSQLVSWSLFFQDRTKVAPERLELASSVLKYALRTGRLPDAFGAKLDEHLAATAKEPYLGVWGSKHDYAALAAWRRRTDPAYQRELLRARRAGWLGWEEPSRAPWLPYIALEMQALTRLALLDDLTEPEQEQLAKAIEEAKRRAPGVTRANYERLTTGITYEKAVALLGGPGEELSSSEIAGLKTVMYAWRGAGIANVTATFQNGKLVNRAQAGLE